MSFGSSDLAPQPQQKILNIAPERASTNEEARPVPLFWGTTRLAVTFLDKAINVRTKKITEDQQAGKNDTQTVTSGYEYRADLLGLISLGPIDQLRKIWFSGSQGWRGHINAGLNNHENFTLDDERGNATIFFGTNGQNVVYGNGHPDYRYQSVLKLEKFLFGFNTTSAPSIEVEVARWPRFAWMRAGDYKVGDDSNPISIIADMMTHNLLYDLPESSLDTDQLAEAAAILKDEGIGLSPVLTRGVRMDQFLVEICSYFDGVPHWKNNKLQIRLQRNAPNRSTLVRVDKHSLVEPPDISAGDWTTTANQTRLVFLRRDNEYKEAALTWSDHGNALLTGSSRLRTLQRPWITTQALAQKLASQAGRRASVPEISGKITVIERVVRNLVCGDFFRLVYEYPEIDLVCRITERRMDRPDSRNVDLTWSAEPTQEGDSVDETPPRDEGIPGVPVASPALRILELPYPLASAYSATVGVLAVRGNGLTTQFSLWGSRTVADYTNLLTSSSFCIAGELTADFATGNTIDRSVGMVLDVGGFADQTLAGNTLNNASINNTLVLVGNEWMSLAAVTLISPGVYRLTGLIRGRFDTDIATHANGAIALIVPRAQITRSTSAAYAAGQSWNYKTQPRVGATALDLATITPAVLALAFNTLRPPSIKNLRVNGDRSGGSYSNASALIISWSQTTWALPYFFNWSYFQPGFDPEMSGIIEIYNAGILKRTIGVPAGATLTYSGAQHTADFPSGGTGTIKVWTNWRGYRSLNSADHTITSTP